MSQKLLLIINPKSGKKSSKTSTMEMVDRFIKQGYRVEIYVTQFNGDGEKMARDHGEEFDLVVCQGGDGTLNETVNGLMVLEKKPLIGYIPAGTTNDFANSHQIPLEVERAVECICTGVPFAFDVGGFNDRYFTYVAAFGAFTDVSYTTPRDTKALLGHMAYILESVQKIPELHPYSVRIELDGIVYEKQIMLCLISNSNCIGGFERFQGNNVSLDDGRFEILLVEYTQNLKELNDAVKGLLNPKHKTPLITRCSASHIKISSQTPIHWTLDGEYGGSHQEAVLVNHKKALEIMHPIGADFENIISDSN